MAISALHEGQLFRFLTKPCPPEMLTKTLDDALEQYRLVRTEQILTHWLERTNEELSGLSQRLEEMVAQRTETLRRLHQFVSELNGLDTLEDVAEVVVATAAEMLHSRRVSLMLPHSSGEYLSIIAATDVADQIKERIRVPIGAPIAGWVFAQNRSMVVNEPAELPQESDRYDSDFFVSLPLISTSMTSPSGSVGVLNVTNQLNPTGYTDEDLANLKAIAEAAAIAIRNQIRLRERNEARDATILALAKLAENRDPETGTHLERVQHFCRLLAEGLAEKPHYASIIDRHFIDNLVRSCPLHDIGKVGIPDHILLKPGRLTPEEFEIMKRHSAIGGDTIRSLVEQGRNQQFLEMGMAIAYHHHEKWDGGGYPHGLSGQNIPLPARIVALADVYDALTCKRVYKEAMSHEKAVSIITEGNGKHFDPEMVEVFLARQNEFDRLRQELTDNLCSTSTSPVFSNRRALPDGEQPVTVAATNSVS